MVSGLWFLVPGSNFGHQILPSAFSLSFASRLMPIHYLHPTYKLSANAVKKNHTFFCESAPIIANMYKLFSA